MKVTAILTPEDSNKKITLPRKDILTKMAEFLHYGRSIVIDRFGYLNKFSKYNVVGLEDFPIPFGVADFKLFDELCNKRASEFIN